MSLTWEKINDSSVSRFHNEFVIPANGTANMVFNLPDLVNGVPHVYQLLTELLQVTDGFYRMEMGVIPAPVGDGVPKLPTSINKLFNKPVAFSVTLNETINEPTNPDWAFTHYLGNSVNKNNKYSADDGSISSPTLFRGQAFILVRYTNLDNKPGIITHSMYVSHTDLAKVRINAIGAG